VTAAEKPPKRSVRERAEAGALAGAIFATLVGADPFDLRSRSHLIRVVDYVAIALWIVAALLFLYVRAGPDAKSDSAEGQRLVFALAATGAAGALTIAALIVTGFNFSLDRDEVALVLTRAEQNALKQLCPLKRPRKPVVGKITTNTLDSNFVIFDVTGPLEKTQTTDGSCSVRIPRSAILSFRELHGKSLEQLTQ
jgi:hypothetical protein